MYSKTSTNVAVQTKISGRKTKFPWTIQFPSGTTICFSEKPSESWLSEFNAILIKAPTHAAFKID
jgi:hypothetical protein